jgi:hypothetical protein
MKVATVYSVCECQAPLGAEVDEKRYVVRGWAKDGRRKRELNAPANSIGPERVRFDVGWMCPICTRNVLRSFDASGLVYRDQVTPAS